MNASVNKADLLKAVQTAERAVTGKSSLAILSTLLLSVRMDPEQPHTLTIAATDLEISLKTSVPVVATDPGDVAVPAALFADVIKAAPGTTVELELTETHLIAKSGRSRYKVPIFGDPSQFPVLPKVENHGQVVLTESVLREALERVTVACATDDCRPMLCGALWTLEDGAERLAMVATDTHRLHRATLPVVTSEGTISAIVGGRALRELTRLLGGPGEVVLTFDANQVQITSETWGTMTARLTEGTFPKIEKVVPAISQGITLDRQASMEAIRRASIVATGGSDRVILTFGAGNVQIEAKSDDDGTAEEPVEYTGNAPADACEKLALNWKFVLQAIAACPDAQFGLYRGGGIRPVLLHGAEKDAFFAVVMPMALPGF